MYVAETVKSGDSNKKTTIGQRPKIDGHAKLWHTNAKNAYGESSPHTSFIYSQQSKRLKL